MKNPEKDKPSGKGQETPKKGGGNTARALLLATLLGAPATGQAQTAFEEESHYPSDFLSPTLVVPRDYSADKKKGKSAETMDESALEILQNGISVTVEHFLNPSFRLYLEKEGKGEWLNSIKGTIKYFDKLYYEKRGDEITIANSSENPVRGLSKDFKIVIKNGLINEINGEKTDLAKFSNWEGYLDNLIKFDREQEKNAEDPLVEINPALEELESYGYYNLEKFFLEYLRLRKKVTRDEAKFLRDNHEYGEVLEKSREHKPGNGTLKIRPFKVNDRIIVGITATAERDFQPLLSFSSDGHLMESKDEGATFEPKGEKALFRQLVRDKKGKTLEDLPPDPSPLPPPITPEKGAEPEPSPGTTAPSGTGKVPEKEKTKATDSKKEPEPPAPIAKKKLFDTLKEDPKFIVKIIENPDELMNFAATNNPKKRKAMQDVVNLIKANQNQEWFKSGVVKLKKDANGNKLNVPTSLGDIPSFYTSYFPDMPYGTMLDLGLIVSNF